MLVGLEPCIEHTQCLHNVCASATRTATALHVFSYRVGVTIALLRAERAVRRSRRPQAGLLYPRAAMANPVPNPNVKAGPRPRRDTGEAHRTPPKLLV